MHLHLLSHLSFALHDPELKAALTRRAPPAAILAEFGRVERAIKEETNIETKNDG
jgi:hypothetical protein